MMIYTTPARRLPVMDFVVRCVSRFELATAKQSMNWESWASRRPLP